MGFPGGGVPTPLRSIPLSHWAVVVVSDSEGLVAGPPGIVPMLLVMVRVDVDERGGPVCVHVIWERTLEEGWYPGRGGRWQR